jgi:predicted nucleic acid-binding Zn ribbon protein
VIDWAAVAGAAAVAAPVLAWLSQLERRLARLEAILEARLPPPGHSHPHE